MAEFELSTDRIREEFVRALEAKTALSAIFVLVRHTPASEDGEVVLGKIEFGLRENLRELLEYNRLLGRTEALGWLLNGGSPLIETPTMTLLREWPSITEERISE